MKSMVIQKKQANKYEIVKNRLSERCKDDITSSLILMKLTYI